MRMVQMIGQANMDMVGVNGHLWNARILHDRD